MPDDDLNRDLSPLRPRGAPATAQRWKRGVAAVVVAGVLLGVGFLAANLLGDAALFFYNVDEATERRDELGSQRFRVQGTPQGTPVDGFLGDQTAIGFSIGFNSVVMDVVHLGDPPELFQPGVPVVLEGAWHSGATPVGSPGSTDSWHFVSDRMLVKHDNDYRNRDDYDERISEADEYGAPAS